MKNSTERPPAQPLRRSELKRSPPLLDEQSLRLKLAAAHLLTVAELEGLIHGGEEVQLIDAGGAALTVRPRGGQS
jgi:hypothetical protein